MSALGWITIAVLGACIVFGVGMAIGAAIASGKPAPPTLRQHADDAIAITRERRCRRPPS